MSRPEISPPVPRRGRVRWILIGLAFAAIAINYIDRANLSVALPYMDKDLGLDPAASGLVLGAFFWTYALCQLPLGWLVDRLGARTMFAAAVAWWSIFTAATVLARGFGSLFGLRLLLGVGEAGAFPAATKMVEEWFPRRERGIASGIYDSGARGGTLLSIPIVTALIAALGWKGSFIVTGSLGLVWVIIWLWAYHSPIKHRWISEAELAYIKAGGARVDPDQQEVDHDRPAVRWRDLFTNRTVWGMAIGFGCQSYVIYFFITWFPSYLVEERHFSLLELGIWGTVPGFVAFLGNFLGGWVSDALVRRGHSVTVARKSCIIAGMLGSAVIGFVGLVPSAVLALVLLSFSFGCVTFATSSIVALPADVAPTSGASMAGSIQGFQNGIANLAGIASPAVIGALYGLTGSFGWGLASAAFVAVAGCVVYLIVVGPIRPMDRKEPAAS
ncbi:MFS transporter [Microlunatus soli]|uniref:D-galactonate transporter n=1 Tax=Microlunatus soli TaxID=630515 RepID=A0A1H1YIZ7_9ACTN|nr:MFS transporter [Microlunatus soli]SDT21393.1 D-galactonate transporter [Microlunatus soli]